MRRAIAVNGCGKTAKELEDNLVHACNQSFRKKKKSVRTTNPYTGAQKRLQKHVGIPGKPGEDHKDCSDGPTSRIKQRKTRKQLTRI